MNNCFFTLVGVDAVEDDANEDDAKDDDVEDVDAKADEDLKRDEEEI